MGTTPGEPRRGDCGEGNSLRERRGAVPFAPAAHFPLRSSLCAVPSAQFPRRSSRGAFPGLFPLFPSFSGTEVAELSVIQEVRMPEKATINRARKDKREGKSASTQAGEFVREEIHHIREGKHGARSTEQAIAIGLSKARRAGVKLAAPKKGTASRRTRTRAKRDLATGRKRAKGPVSRRRSVAMTKKLRHEGSSAASPRALARHARAVARRRGPAKRSAAARKAMRTKGPVARRKAARKAARTRARSS